MRFSVVTVTFRNLAGLRHTAASLPAASGLLEWIVIDGGSRDGTPEWLASLGRPDLIWLSEPDTGIFDAMNKGLALARGDYVIFMNAGDSFATPGVLQEIAATLGPARPDLVYGDSLEVDAAGGCWHKPARHPRWNIYAMFTHHQAILYRRDLLFPGHDPAYVFCGDWALTARILRRPGAQSRRFAGIICRFQRGGVSQRNTHRAQINAEHWRILRRDQRLAPLFALLLYHSKRAANALRHAWPGLYDRLRFARPRG